MFICRARAFVYTFLTSCLHISDWKCKFETDISSLLSEIFIWNLGRSLKITTFWYMCMKFYHWWKKISKSAIFELFDIFCKNVKNSHFCKMVIFGLPRVPKMAIFSKMAVFEKMAIFSKKWKKWKKWQKWPFLSEMLHQTAWNGLRHAVYH